MSTQRRRITPVARTPLKTAANESTLGEKFAGRKSHELIIAFAGPIGCGIQSVVETTSGRLKDRGYDVQHIKLSEFLETSLKEGLTSEWQPPQGSSARFNRYRRLQESGKELREKSKNPAILAEYAIRQIAIDRNRRQTKHGETPESMSGPLIPQRVAYLIDQVKRPEEIALLRIIYRNLFYLTGITRIKDLREQELLREKLQPVEAIDLIEIDRHESDSNGQQLDKTLQLADYFIRNDAKTIDDKKKKIDRFLDLIHGNKSITPSKMEHGMYAAFTAGLRSACLSRQVGAAIATADGEVISTGCNDVPQAGGGLYTSDSSKDMRCIHQDGQICFNDSHKRQLQSDLGVVIVKELGKIVRGNQPIALANDELSHLLDVIYQDTRIKDLIEFSRSVHAEMDAIVALARIGGSGVSGATLYSTTFPCHNCARHIIAAGITKVFYIEPYEKSLAKELHQDAIAFEVEETKIGKPKRVEFLHFEGVAPRQFSNMFRAENRKNSTGKFVPIEIRTAEKVLSEYIDNYQDFEKKTVAHLEEQLEKLRPTT